MDMSVDNPHRRGIAANEEGVQAGGGTRNRVALLLLDSGSLLHLLVLLGLLVLLLFSRPRSFNYAITVSVLGGRIIDDIDYLLAESSSAAGFKGTLILCQHGRLCRSVSRQTSYDAGYTAVLLAA